MIIRYEYLASTRAAGYNDVDRLALRHWVHLAEPRRTTLPRAHLRRGRGQWDRCRLRRTERYAQFDRGFDTIENKPTSSSSSSSLPATVSIASTRILPPSPSIPTFPLFLYIWCTLCRPPPPLVPRSTYPMIDPDFVHVRTHVFSRIERGEILLFFFFFLDGREKFITLSSSSSSP